MGFQWRDVESLENDWYAYSLLKPEEFKELSAEDKKALADFRKSQESEESTQEFNLRRAHEKGQMENY